MEHELPCGVEARGKIGEAETDRLMIDDRLSHRYAILRISDGDVERSLGNADRLGGDADAPRLQIAEPDRIAPALGSHHQRGQ